MELRAPVNTAVSAGVEQGGLVCLGSSADSWDAHRL